jgi:hypothetical protein
MTMMNEYDHEGNHSWEGGCLYVGIGSLLGGLAIGLAFVIISLVRLSVSRDLPPPEVTILPPNTNTPTIRTVIPDAAVASQTPPDPMGSDQDKDFVIGDLVEVYGTEGQGLRIRNTPSLSAVIDEIGLDSEVFKIEGGPIDADGYVWWFLVNPYDPSRQGWSVSNFLRSISP